MKKYVLWFHYNKPLSKKTGSDQWSVHFRNTCHIVDHIDCRIPTHSKTNKRQPRVVMRCHATNLQIKNGTAIIQ